MVRSISIFSLLDGNACELHTYIPLNPNYVYPNSASPELNSKAYPWPFQCYLIKKGSLPEGRSAQTETAAVTDGNFNSSLTQVMMMCTDYQESSQRPGRHRKTWLAWLDISVISFVVYPPWYLPPHPPHHSWLCRMNYRKNEIKKTNIPNRCSAMDGFWPQRQRAHMCSICQPVLNFFFQLDVIRFFQFFYFWSVGRNGTFHENWQLCFCFVGFFFNFLRPAEQSTERKLACSSWF